VNGNVREFSCSEELASFVQEKSENSSVLDRLVFKNSRWIRQKIPKQLH